MAYDKVKSFGSSAIKELLKGMAHYMAWVESEETANCFEVGKAADALLCQNIDFDDLVYVAPAVDEDGKSHAHSAKGKTERERHRALGKAVISESDAENIMAMVAELHRHPKAARFFDKGNVSVRFQEVFTLEYILDNGDTVILRATPDVTIYCDGVIVGWVDYKSTAKETHRDFINQFKWLDYGVQAGMYTTIMANNGAVFDSSNAMFEGIGEAVVYVGQSKKAPYDVFVTPIGSEVITHGWAKVEEAMRILSEGRENIKASKYIGYAEVIKIGGFTQTKKESDLEISENGIVKLF